MKIRYHKVGSPYYNTTKEFNPDGVLLNNYRMAVLKDGKPLTGTAMKAYLERPLFPDIPFSVALPIIRQPKFHYENYRWIMVLKPDGTYLKKMTADKVWDITEEEYQASLERFAEVMLQYLVCAQEVALPNIPDVGYEWEEVFEDRPIRERYVKIPVEVGRFRGNYWQFTDFDLFPLVIGQASLLSNPLYFICNRIFT